MPSALASPATGYSFVYHLEMYLLFATLVALGPLVRSQLGHVLAVEHLDFTDDVRAWMALSPEQTALPVHVAEDPLSAVAVNPKRVTRSASVSNASNPRSMPSLGLAASKEGP